MNRGKSYLIFALALFIMLSIFIPSTPAFDDVEFGRGTQESLFSYTNVLNQPGGSLAGGIELGDPDNDLNKEVIVVGGSGEAGRVTIIDYNSSKKSFDTPTIWVDSQALVDVVSADIDPFVAGEELIVGGYSKNVTILYWSGGLSEPDVESIDTLPQQIFGITAGDFNSSHSGLELAVVDGKTANLTIYQSTNSQDKWDKFVLKFEETLRNVEAGEFDPDNEGEELVILSSNGTVYVVTRSGQKWDIEKVWQDDDKLLDAAIGDADSRFSGNEIITVGLSRHTTMLRKTDSGGWNITLLWEAPGGLEGIDIGEFDPSNDHNEIAIGGYSRTVVMLSLVENEWAASEIYQDNDTSQSELNGVVIGEFYPDHLGSELIVVGASGETTLLEYVYPEFTISTASSSIEIQQGDSAIFTIVIDRISSYSGTVTIAATSELNVSLSPETVTVPGTSTLTIQSKLPGKYSVEVTASDVDNSKSITLSVIVHSFTIPDFKLNLSTASIDLYRFSGSENKYGSSADDSTSQTLTVKIIALNYFDNKVNIEVTGLPEYFESVISLEDPLPGEESQISIKLIGNPPDDEDEFSFKVVGESGELLHFEDVTINLHPARPVDDESISDTVEWVPPLRIAFIILIIILVAAIIFLKIYKYKSKHSENKSKNQE